MKSQPSKQNLRATLPAAPRHDVRISFKRSGLRPPLYVAGSFTRIPWTPIEMNFETDSPEREPFTDELQFFSDFRVPEGTYQYKFRNGSGDWWAVDEDMPTVVDEEGNENNLLAVLNPAGSTLRSKSHSSAATSESDASTCYTKATHQSRVFADGKEPSEEIQPSPAMQSSWTGDHQSVTVPAMPSPVLSARPHDSCASLRAAAVKLHAEDILSPENYTSDPGTQREGSLPSPRCSRHIGRHAHSTDDCSESVALGEAFDACDTEEKHVARPASPPVVDALKALNNTSQGIIPGHQEQPLAEPTGTATSERPRSRKLGPTQTAMWRLFRYIWATIMSVMSLPFAKLQPKSKTHALAVAVATLVAILALTGHHLLS